MDEQTEDEQTRRFFWGIVLIQYLVLFSILKFTSNPAKMRILSGLFTLSLIYSPWLVYNAQGGALSLNLFLYPLIVFILLKKNGASISWISPLFLPAMLLFT